MLHYNLEPGEFEIRQESSVYLWSSGEKEPIKEIVLTNKHLILVDSTGVFNVRYYAKYCPLSDIVRYQGIPQVTTARIRADKVLHIPFEDETISLTVENAKAWANAIQQAAMGNLEEIAQKDAAIEQVANIADGAKDVASAIGGGLAGTIVGGIGAFATSAIEQAGLGGIIPDSPNKKKDSQGQPAANAKCQGCHAPLSGRKGIEVTCEYCGTKQTL